MANVAQSAAMNCTKWTAPRTRAWASEESQENRAAVFMLQGLLTLCLAIGEMRGRAPGATREQLEASNRLDASNRLVRAQASTGHGSERHLAVGPLQIAKCSRAVLELAHRLLCRNAICSELFL